MGRFQITRELRIAYTLVCLNGVWSSSLLPRQGIGHCLSYTRVSFIRDKRVLLIESALLSGYEKGWPGSWKAAARRAASDGRRPWTVSNVGHRRDGPPPPALEPSLSRGPHRGTPGSAEHTLACTGGAERRGRSWEALIGKVVHSAVSRFPCLDLRVLDYDSSSGRDDEIAW